MGRQVAARWELASAGDWCLGGFVACEGQTCRAVTRAVHRIDGSRRYREDLGLEWSRDTYGRLWCSRTCKDVHEPPRVACPAGCSEGVTRYPGGRELACLTCGGTDAIDAPVVCPGCGAPRNHAPALLRLWRDQGATDDELRTVYAPCGACAGGDA